MLRKKLSEQQIALLKLLYQEAGWMNSDIAQRLGIVNSHITFYIKSLGLLRNFPVQKFRVYAPKPVNYAGILKQQRAFECQSCDHRNWIRRCSRCMMILESDATKDEDIRGKLCDVPIRILEPIG